MTEETWVRVAAASEIAEGSVVSVMVGDRDIAVYHLEGGEYCATDNVCTHEYAQLSEGFLDGTVIECPLHGGCFDVRTGKGLCAPITENLAVLETELRGGDVMVRIVG